MNQSNRADGFTIIELMLAMGFVAALLVAIAVTVMQVGGMYNRGLTMKAVNSASTAIADDFRKTIASSVNFNPAVTSKYVEFKDAAGYRIGGRICTGEYTYAWNRADYVLRTAAAGKRNYYLSAADTKDLYLIKINDASQYYCLNPTAAIRDTDRPTELLNASNPSATTSNSSNLLLAVYDISATMLTSDSLTKQSMVNIQITLGTADSPAMSSVVNPQCLTDGAGENINFCSFSQLNLVIRTGSNAS